MTHEEPELLTDIRDFTTQFYVILGCKFSEFVRVVYRECFVIWSLDIAICDFASFEHCF